MSILDRWVICDKGQLSRRYDGRYVLKVDAQNIAARANWFFPGPQGEPYPHHIHRESEIDGEGRCACRKYK